MKKIVNLLLIFVSLFAINISNVFAENTVDFSKKGSIDIQLLENETNTPVEGVGISAIKVANVGLKDENLVLENIEEIKSCNVDFENLETDFTVSDGLADCIVKSVEKLDTKVTDSKGKVSFSDLDLGLYLIVQTSDVKGYSKFDPYLVLIPQDIDNNWVYDISSEPKTEIIRLVDINIKKEWNSEGNSHPNKVDIELIRDELVIETITLSEENNWTYTVENIEMDDNYSVREKDIPENYTVSYRQDGYTFIVTNTIKLPQTGMVLWKVELMAGLGLVLIITGIVLRKYDKN